MGTYMRLPSLKPATGVNVDPPLRNIYQPEASTTAPEKWALHAAFPKVPPLPMNMAPSSAGPQSRKNSSGLEKVGRVVYRETNANEAGIPHRRRQQ